MNKINLKPGIVVLFHTVQESLISRAIGRVTDSVYSHVGIVKSVGQDTVILAEALDDGFIEKEYKHEDLYWMQKQNSISLRKTQIPLNNIESAINKYIGKPYGWFQIFAILLYTYTKIQITRDNLRHLICSEAVARVLYDASGKQINFEKEFGKPFDYITPQDIAVTDQLIDYEG